MLVQIVLAVQYPPSTHSSISKGCHNNSFPLFMMNGYQCILFHSFFHRHDSHWGNHNRSSRAHWCTLLVEGNTHQLHTRQYLMVELAGRILNNCTSTYQCSRCHQRQKKCRHPRSQPGTSTCRIFLYQCIMCSTHNCPFLARTRQLAFMSIFESSVEERAIPKAGQSGEISVGGLGSLHARLLN